MKLFITSPVINLCFEVLTEQRTILTLALTPSLALALALEAKSLALALALRVVALTPSLVIHRKRTLHAAVNTYVPDTAPCCLEAHMFTADAPSPHYISMIGP